MIWSDLLERRHAPARGFGEVKQVLRSDLWERPSVPAPDAERPLERRHQPARGFGEVKQVLRSDLWERPSVPAPRFILCRKLMFYLGF